ncbi:RNA-binding CRS1 / YhbY (CRM) domain-containing protein [Actinidia rufa]|uniref:RNA-binding CRS1 / YhbY (CRM) domain-containing protein n=1 Tax=Actinidia rufa TaxID=165716 RepID=A0A7J0G2C4_9ERIC|nr:RNA-binding CRS1 / YhbY (CRM) domain-containing protein [Actinidia rufa]
MPSTSRSMHGVVRGSLTMQVTFCPLMCLGIAVDRCPLTRLRRGNGGVTHNMIEDIYSHWKRSEAVRINCLGVPTLDMDNVLPP